MEIRKEYGFQEVYLLHKKCVVDSRSECDTSMQLGPIRFKCPVVPANMKSVVDEKTCLYLAERGWFYIMHRFDGVDGEAFTKYMHDKGYFSSISVGVNDNDYRMLTRMKKDGITPEYITLDIANAYSVKAESMVKFIKDNFNSFLIAGNYAIEEAAIDLEEWGADATKAGISNGHVCETYMATGMSRPQFSTVMACSSVAKKPVISDGAIKNVGDIAKALVAGASFVMCGNLFAGYDQSAGEIIEINEKKYKQYFGSASYNNTLKNENIEGRCILVDWKGDMEEKLLNKIEDGLKSSISYSGGKDLTAFNSVDWGVREGGVR